ncbi:hypothetical protein BVG19_g4584 [[Candida] boidinii]|nr:hypothetical protein BVG19_g4584 [[Candida] boidinii]OWB51648.1 hypothetical protein B5S27_g3213 [[Candida] boidinii]
MNNMIYCTRVFIYILISLAIVKGQIILQDQNQDHEVNPVYPQDSNDQYNLLHHLGGVGPYHTSTGFGLDIQTPYKYEVDKVFILSRHGERFPTTRVGNELLKTYRKLQKQYKKLLYINPNFQINDSNNDNPLTFIQDSKFFLSFENSEDSFEMITNSGSYSGVSDMFKLGREIKEKYGYLYDNSTGELPIFSAGEQRVVDSAKSLANGFFSDSEYNAKIHVIPERKRQGLNTLSSYRSCPKAFIKRYNSKLVKSFKKSHIETETDKINEINYPFFKINSKDTLNLLHYCAFELNINGNSSICNKFSREVFNEFEYTRDLELWYNKGPGYHLSELMGSIYVNASLTLMEEEEEESGDKGTFNNKIWISLTHDTDLIFFLTSLGLFDNQEDLNLKEIQFSRFFKTSEMVPMGGRIVLERIVPSERSMKEHKDEKDDRDTNKYLRLKINDSVIPIPNCQEGPGYSCSIKKLRELISKKSISNVDYVKVCKIKSKKPQYLSFYWDYKDNDY